MAVFTNTANAIADPQYYGTNMPEYGTPEWDQFLQWEQSQPWMQPAGQAPGSFTGPDGSQWSSAGSQRMADTTTGAYQANLFNQRLREAAIQGGPNAKMFQLAMNSRAQIRPEEFQNAYNTHDELGNQVLVSPLASLFERLGIRPPDWTAGTSGSHDPTRPFDPTDLGKVPGLNPERNIYLDPVSGQKWTLGGDGKWYTVSHGAYNDVGMVGIDYNPWEQKPGDPGKIKNMQQDLYNASLNQPPAGGGAGQPPASGGDHPGMIYVDGVWQPDMSIIPQSPYPTLPDVNNIPPDKIGMHPLSTQQNLQAFKDWVRQNGRPPVAPPTGYGF